MYARKAYVRVLGVSLTFAFLSVAEPACKQQPVGKAQPSAATPVLIMASPGPRFSMEELHRMGGVPAGWQLSPPPGDVNRGREAFVSFGCHRCHAIAGEAFPESRSGPGPELTGMGEHHPPAYFVEAILNPNGILIEGPDYLTAEGTSRMPSYPDMSLAELADLVAYLSSLRGSEGTSHPHHRPESAEKHAGTHYGPGSAEEHAGHHDHASATGDAERWAYVLQVYELPEHLLESFYDWFARNEDRAIPGLARIETYASRLRTPTGNITVATMFAFENEALASSFLNRQEAQPTNTFVRPVEQVLLRSPVLFRAVQMSRP